MQASANIPSPSAPAEATALAVTLFWVVLALVFFFPTNIFFLWPPTVASHDGEIASHGERHLHSPRQLRGQELSATVL